MKQNSIRTRAVIFAYLFGPPRYLDRNQASRVHSAICDELTYDDFSFKYSSPGNEKSRTFSTVIERAEGRGGFKVTLDFQGEQNPLRLLAEDVWPQSVQHARERLDKASKAVFSALEGDWQRILAEVRLRAECDVGGNDAARYMREHVMRLDPQALSALEAPISFASAKLETEALPPREGDDLFGPKKELTVEVLRENPKCLFIETMCQWPQIAVAPPGSRVEIDLRMIRTIGDSPSKYVDHAYAFLNESFVRLWNGGTHLT